MPPRKLEEAQTIKAATAARKKWEARNGNRELYLYYSDISFVYFFFPIQDEPRVRDYRQNLETELYDLPPSKLAESIAMAGKSYVKSSYRRGTSTAAAIEERIKQLSVSNGGPIKTTRASLESSIIADREDMELAGLISAAEPSFAGEEKERSPVAVSPFDCGEGRILSSSRSGSSVSSDKTPGPASDRTTPNSASNGMPGSASDRTASALDPTSDRILGRSTSGDKTPGSSSDDTGALASASGAVEASFMSSTTPPPLTDQDTQPDSKDKTPSASTHTSPVHSTASSTPPPGADIGGRRLSPHGNEPDQLKVLTAASRVSQGEVKDPVPPAVRSEKEDYEKLTLEAAALTREMWKQTEGECL